MNQPTRHITGPLAGGLVAASLFLAGCGGGTPTGAAAAPAGSRSPSSTKFGQQFVAFATCMRSHGVPSYPDPQITRSGDQVQVRISPGAINPNAPAFKAASNACHRYLPNGGAPPRESPQNRTQQVAYADCMRAHGVPNFPDPGHDGAFDLPAGLNPQAPGFTHAEQACKSEQPSSLSVNQRAGS
jgi:hypothetical protein